MRPSDERPATPRPALSTPARIRVLLLEDLAEEQRLLRELFAGALDMDLVGVAADGREGLEMLARLRPDLVCCDYQMPVMNGLEFVERAPAVHACPVLMLSTAVQSLRPENIFRLMAAGAVEVMAKPRGRDGRIPVPEGRALLDRVREIARAARQGARPRLPARQDLTHPARPRPPLPAPRAERWSQADLVVIGSSTGGPQVLQQVLRQLPADFPAPVVVVQHISDGFLTGLLSWLQTGSALRLVKAPIGQAPEPGHVYFADDGHHLVLDASGRFAREAPTAREVHVPGVDPLMRSAARVLGPRVVGVLLTGMGRDGAQGLKALRDAGALTVAQDEASSVIYGMPAAAVALGAAAHVLPPEGIVSLLLRRRPGPPGLPGSPGAEPGGAAPPAASSTRASPRLG